MKTTEQATLKDLEDTVSANKHLTFDEYAVMKAPAIDAIVNDFAVKLVERAKENGQELSIQDAREIAKEEIPAAFVPEWMKNLRVSANIAGTELTYLEQLKQAVDGLTEMFSVFLDASGYLESYIKKHAADFKRAGGNDGDV